MATSSSQASQTPYYVVPPEGVTRYIASGISADIYQIDEKHVIKRPKFFPGHNKENQHFRKLVDNERKVYERLGPHHGIIKYFGLSDESTGTIKLQYANDGDLSDYISGHPKPQLDRRAEMIRLLAAAWLHIYLRNIAIQDVKSENIFIVDGMPRVGDFTESIIYSLSADMQTVCPHNTLRVDLVGIGCVMYSIATWEVFDFDYFDELRWPGPEDLRPTEGIMCGKIIQNCWDGKYSNMETLHDDIVKSLQEGH